ncbi:MAG: sugar phosphate isomerase/epimerase family protein [Eubacteriales bacterium]
MKYGLQLFSVRDVTPTDLRGTLKKVSEIGYKAVEFAGFFGHPAEDVRSWLDEYGLECSGTHTGVEEIADHFEETVRYHKIIGNRNIIIPGADLSTQEKLDHFIDTVNRLIPALAAEGIALGYHNHSHEFIPTSYGKIIHHEIETRTSVELEIDTFWAYHAGEDPIAILDRLKDRIRVIHLKDGLENGTGKPLGMGIAPVKEVHAKAKELGIFQVVESETLTPDGLTEARICFDCLKKLDGIQ